MATCDLGYDHEDAVEAEPATEVVVEAEPEHVSEAVVEVAAIEADRDVKIAELQVQEAQVWNESRVAELEGKVRGMEEMLDTLRTPPPEAEPEPVVIPVPEPEPVADAEAAPPPEGSSNGGEPKRKVSKNAWGF
jgi:hypothetical protein